MTTFELYGNILDTVQKERKRVAILIDSGSYTLNSIMDYLYELRQLENALIWCIDKQIPVQEITIRMEIINKLYKKLHLTKTA